MPNFKPSRSNVPSGANPLVSDGAVRQVEAQREPQDNRERSQELVRKYTDGAIKVDQFLQNLIALGIDARPDSEIQRLSARLENGDERVGFRVFNKAIAMQFA